MRVCTLVKIIKDKAAGNGEKAEAWKLAYNQIIANSTPATAGTTVPLQLVASAIALAQHHLESREEEKSSSEDADDNDSMVTEDNVTGA
eukprot:1189898-Rhodomonas_salina.1